MLHNLIAESEGYDARKTDYGPHPVVEHHFNEETCNLETPAGLFNSSVSLPLSSWALEQVCERLGPAAFPGTSARIPLKYMEACDPDLRAENLNRWIPKLPPQREWFVRAYDDYCRAVLTDKYTVVGVSETLKWAQQFIDEKARGNGQVVQTYLTPDKLKLKVVFKYPDYGNGGGGGYGVGVQVKTGETGRWCLATGPFVMETSCTNSIVWQKDGYWQHNHTGDANILRTQFIAAIAGAFQASGELLNAVLAAEEIELPDIDTIFDGMCKKHGWQGDTRDQIMRGTRGDETVLGLVRGITEAAQVCDDEEDQFKMEDIAGEFLWVMTRERQHALLER
jgi:hypothetical protein